MIRKLSTGSFEDFTRWLAGSEEDSGSLRIDPSLPLLDAARTAWQEIQSLRRTQSESLAAELRAGTYQEVLELAAAADPDRRRWLPRLRSANGFAISALYATDARPGAAPVGLLVECPIELIDLCRGQKVRVAAASRWVELGEFDADGKVIGDLPDTFELKPPFAFRVGDGGWTEELSSLASPDHSE